MQISSELISEKLKLSSLVMLYMWKTHSGDLRVRRKLINRKSEGVLRNIENAIDMIECDFTVIFLTFWSWAEHPHQKGHHGPNWDELRIQRERDTVYTEIASITKPFKRIDKRDIHSQGSLQESWEEMVRK